MSAAGDPSRRGPIYLEHKFGYDEDVIANLGVRYGYENRLLGTSIGEVNPPTMIFGLEATLRAIFSYSESLGDVSYW